MACPMRLLIGPKIELINPVILPIISPIIPPRMFSTKHDAAFKILFSISLRIPAMRSSNPNRIL